MIWFMIWFFAILQNDFDLNFEKKMKKKFISLEFQFFSIDTYQLVLSANFPKYG